MKKIYSFLLIFLFSIMLVSCGSKNNNENNSNNDDKDNVEIPEENGPAQSAKESVTIYLAGDSTVKTYEDEQYIAGWGQYLDLFLSPNVNVVNCAEGGRSSRSFINEGRLYDIDDTSFNYTFDLNNSKSIESTIKAGDYLFIQFGHNDDHTKLVSNPSSNYKTQYDRMIPLGDPDSDGIYPITAGEKVATNEESLPESFLNYATSSEKETALSTISEYGSTYYSYDCGGTYKWYLKQYIDFAREMKAIPVLITPVPRIKFDGSGKTIIGGAGRHGDNFAYVEAVRQLAESENCLLIDLFEETKEILEESTVVYANYLMALKPNSLTGNWPSGYDSSYSSAEGIEATHYNKYGSFLQAAEVAGALSLLDDLDSEKIVFKDEINKIPEKYILPSTKLTESVVNNIEDLIDGVILK